MMTQAKRKKLAQLVASAVSRSMREQHTQVDRWESGVVDVVELFTLFINEFIRVTEGVARDVAEGGHFQCVADELQLEHDLTVVDTPTRKTTTRHFLYVMLGVQGSWKVLVCRGAVPCGWARGMNFRQRSAKKGTDAQQLTFILPLLVRLFTHCKFCGAILKTITSKLAEMEEVVNVREEDERR